jgi:hypothetical protein
VLGSAVHKFIEEHGMEFGFFLATIDFNAVRESARLTEELGFDMVVFPIISSINNPVAVTTCMQSPTTPSC